MATIGSGPTTTSIGGANMRGAATGVLTVFGSNSNSRPLRKLVGSLKTPGHFAPPLAFAPPKAPKGAAHVPELDEILLDAARLGYEVQTVMTLRMLKLARGGKAAETEARRMVAEKGVAFAEAATTLATGGSMNKVVRRVRSRVSKNKRRLSRSSLSP